LARADAPFTGDTCGNAGGHDQNICGTSIVIPESTIRVPATGRGPRLAPWLFTVDGASRCQA